MNNLRFGSIILASAGAVWLAQFNSLKGRQAENLKLTQELAELQTSFQATSSAWTNAETDLRLRRDALKSAEVELRMGTQEFGDIPLKPHDPKREGSWPQDEPYFYLAKRHLGEIGYSPFSREGGIFPATAFLFGMSAKEKQQVDEAFHTLCTKANELQRSKAERIDPKPGVNTDKHREVSYKISAMTNEVQELQKEFNSAVKNALGTTRSDMFLARAAAFFEEDYSGTFGRTDYIITSEATRKSDGSVEYRIKLTEPGVGSTMYFPFDYPLEPGTPAWNNRHLFGEEPLLKENSKE